MAEMIVYPLSSLTLKIFLQLSSLRWLSAGREEDSPLKYSVHQESGDHVGKAAPAEQFQLSASTIYPIA